MLAQQTFETVAAGRQLDSVTVRDLVQLPFQRAGRALRYLAAFG